MSKVLIIINDLLAWLNWRVMWLMHDMVFKTSRKELEGRYWAAVNPVLIKHSKLLSRVQAEAYLKPWLRSVAFSRGSLSDGLPLMPFPAIDFLNSIISDKFRIFEYGAGGSSVFFSSRAAEIVSVEHDPHWFHQTEKVMNVKQRRYGINWRGVLAPPKKIDQQNKLPPSDPISYTTSDKTYYGLSFFEYAAVIDEYPNSYFDVVLIDGRARPSCFLHAMSKIKLGGYIILDNAESSEYAYVEETARKLGFELTEFWGPGPYNDHCWRTIFLRRVTERYALNDLDKQLEVYLNFDNGVFVEAGANDGIRQSNTLYFEASRGWKGVLVEAVPELYEECRRNRPNATVVWGALNAGENSDGFATIRYAGLMSVIKGGMKSDKEELMHIELGCKVQNISNSYEVEVPNTSLSAILLKLGIDHVDLLSLDLEGYEAQALGGLDFSIHKPKFILVEARYPNDIDAKLLPLYEVAATLSHHDILYRLR